MSRTFSRHTDALTLGPARERLWSAVHRGDEHRAAAVVLDALESAGDAETVLLDLIAPVQARVGTEWAANRLTVAQEHTATAIHDRVIALLAHRPGNRSQTPRAPRVTVACVDGEWHALPARLLAEVLRLRGWRVDFLGAHVPTPHLIAHLHQTGSRTVGLSSSTRPQPSTWPTRNRSRGSSSGPPTSSPLAVSPRTASTPLSTCWPSTSRTSPRACRTLAHAREALGTRTPLPEIPGPGKPA